MVYTFKLLHSWKQHANYGRDFLKLILIDETVNKFSVFSPWTPEGGDIGQVDCHPGEWRDRSIESDLGPAPRVALARRPSAGARSLSGPTTIERCIGHPARGPDRSRWESWPGETAARRFRRLRHGGEVHLHCIIPTLREYIVVSRRELRRACSASRRSGAELP